MLFSAVVIMLILLEVWAPKPINWTPTLGNRDKIPYGTYILDQEMQERFFLAPGVDNRTFYEICTDEQEQPPKAIISFSTALDLDSLDAAAIMQFVQQGGVAFISASEIYGALADTLKLETRGSWVGSLDLSKLTEDDSVTINYVNSNLFPEQAYHFRSPVVYSYFNSVDTLKTEIIAVNAQQYPVMIKVQAGSGYFLLNTTPLSFSNYYMLKPPNQEYAAKALSYLPTGKFVRTEYYQRGRLEPTSPLRFIVSHPALKTAYYLTIAALVLFVFFEAKRKQKAIPLITPLRNTTLDFTQTLGRLYYEQRDHRNMASKMINYFLEDIRSHYYLATNKFDEDFFNSLSRKSNKDLKQVRDLFALINSINVKTQISDEQLISLNQKINKFRKGSQINIDYV